MERDRKWLHASPTPTTNAWFVTISRFDGTTEPASASFLWPDGPDLKIPNKMVLMTVAAFADLQHRAALSSEQRQGD